MTSSILSTTEHLRARANPSIPPQSQDDSFSIPDSPQFSSSSSSSSSLISPNNNNKINDNNNNNNNNHFTYNPIPTSPLSKVHHLVPETEARDMFSSVKNAIISQNPNLNTPIPPAWIYNIPSILGMTHGNDAAFYFHVDVTAGVRFTWQDLLVALEQMWMPVRGLEEGPGSAAWGEDPWYQMDVVERVGMGVVARVGFGNFFDPTD